jgi:hypothetical protein
MRRVCRWFGETSSVLRILIRNCLSKWLLVRLNKKNGRAVFRWIIVSEFVRTGSGWNRL